MCSEPTAGMVMRNKGAGKESTAGLLLSKDQPLGRQAYRFWLKPKAARAGLIGLGLPR